MKLTSYSTAGFKKNLVAVNLPILFYEIRFDSFAFATFVLVVEFYKIN